MVACIGFRRHTRSGLMYGKPREQARLLDRRMHVLMQVDEVKSDEVICTSRNSAQLDGLLTVFHTERSADSLQNIQNDLPILTDYDKKVIKEICKVVEIDFLSLSFVREGEDLAIAREFLESIGATTTKVGAVSVALMRSWYPVGFLGAYCKLALMHATLSNPVSPLTTVYSPSVSEHFSSSLWGSSAYECLSDSMWINLMACH